VRAERLAVAATRWLTPAPRPTTHACTDVLRAAVTRSSDSECSSALPLDTLKAVHQAATSAAKVGDYMPKATSLTGVVAILDNLQVRCGGGCAVLVCARLLTGDTLPATHPLPLAEGAAPARHHQAGRWADMSGRGGACSCSRAGEGTRSYSPHTPIPQNRPHCRAGGEPRGADPYAAPG
jgi:hypothetical protein